MEPKTQDESAYYVWAPPGKDHVVHIHLDVVDNLLAEIMRGFGAVPKRGAEVGGVLIGSIEPGSPTVVRIEDFEPVECGYTRGPSYLLSPEEQAEFADACQRWQHASDRPGYAVGYYRSHTRDGLALAAEDLELLDHYFPGASNVALLVKPVMSKASPGGFFFREAGAFPHATPLEFPFRRRELTGEAPPPHRPMTDRKRGERAAPSLVPSPSRAPRPEPSPDPAEATEFGHAYAVTTPTRNRLKGWMFFPLSFVFLLLGALLGAQAVLTMGNKPANVSSSDLSLGLAVSKTDQDLTVNWNRASPAIRSAQRGLLEIQDGGFSKPVELDTAYLQSGHIIYQIHNPSNSVQFRLTVYVNSRLTVTETLDWKQ
jgi:hypothetical protein